MAHRGANRQRNLWVVSLLDVRPADRMLEIGFGPGRDGRAARPGRSGSANQEILNCSREPIAVARARSIPWLPAV